MFLRLLPLLVIALVLAIWLLGTGRRGQPQTVAHGPPPTTTTRHDEAVAAAREQLQHAQAAHARAVEAAQDRLTDAGLDRSVCTLGDLELCRMSVLASGQRRWLTPDTTFAMEVVGEPRWGTVPAEEGLRITPEDDRVVRVRVSDPGWAETARLPIAQEDDARSFVAAGTSAVRTLAQARAARQSRIEVALEELRVAREDTEQLDLARMTLEDLEGAGPLRRDLPAPPERDDDDRDDDGR
ncbi:hypothetical protein SGUI_0644 [Serinicoccus hydrothermalis]|uniref:Uncharacterized protein n=1 Tax=Serinicoccus hydrothermalis TaxID=1758689 RepID=A0A1B1N9B8_9MICO|nr:hypothetical protein [Serinicoccus hydrothermalis]ANS78040.1 hypothetical protein SGUI_0644 [Serinicoccus hydrothermalis]